MKKVVTLDRINVEVMLENNGDDDFRAFEHKRPHLYSTFTKVSCFRNEFTIVLLTQGF